MAFWSLTLHRIAWFGAATVWLSQLCCVSPAQAEPAAPPGEAGDAPAPNKMQCIEAHQRTQQMQLSHRYLEARAQAQVCIHQSCPGPLVADCERWINELDQRVPSVVFDVRLNGQHASSATVTVDGQPAEWTRGEAIRLNPGEHTFRFNLPPFPAITKMLILTEGARYQSVSADFSAPPPTPTASEPPRKEEPTRGNRPVPTVVYPLLAAAGVGLGLFAGLAAAGKIEQGELERTCAPHCSDGELASMRQHYLMGDVALAVGAAALLGAGVIYFTRPEEPSRVTWSPLPGGGLVGLRHSF